MGHECIHRTNRIHKAYEIYLFSSHAACHEFTNPFLKTKDLGAVYMCKWAEFVVDF